MPNRIAQLTYVSTLAQLDAERRDEALCQIITVAHPHNVAHNITGMLLCYQNYYIQHLEGAGSDVDNLFARIRLDPRHTEVMIANYRWAGDRIFPEWAMCSPGLSKTEDMIARRLEIAAFRPYALRNDHAVGLFSRIREVYGRVQSSVPAEAEASLTTSGSSLVLLD